MTASLLIVDDDRLTRETLASAFSDKYQTSVARSGVEALEILEAEKTDVVLFDLRMPDMDGLALLGRITQQQGRQPSVIFITGHATVEAAVEAMKLGAHDFITKPLNLDRLGMMLEKALETPKLREENVELKRSIRESNTPTHMVGKSPTMKKILDLAEQVASTDASVLIEGESGTGKELIASLIHYNSRRADAPFIKINCAAFAEGVLESELFGHERGAFTGAVAARKGRFEMADGGTLFLDEIGDLPVSAQVKLLRFLQERTFERVGGNKTHKVDVRVISATHRNLEELVRTRTVPRGPALPSARHRHHRPAPQGAGGRHRTPGHALRAAFRQNPSPSHRQHRGRRDAADEDPPLVGQCSRTDELCREHGGADQREADHPGQHSRPHALRLRRDACRVPGHRHPRGNGKTGHCRRPGKHPRKQGRGGKAAWNRIAHPLPQDRQVAALIR